MAGMPRKVIDRANKLLVMLEKTHSNESFKQAGGGKSDKEKTLPIKLHTA
jgi:DNA mismatch repair ATPase MutS